MNTSYTNELPREVDWSTLCLRLTRVLRRKEIAYYISADSTTVTRYITDGNVPRFRFAIKLLSLAYDHLPYEELMRCVNISRMPKLPRAFDVKKAVNVLTETHTHEELSELLGVHQTFVSKMGKERKAIQYASGVGVYNYAINYLDNETFDQLVTWHVDELDMAA